MASCLHHQDIEHRTTALETEFKDFRKWREDVVTWFIRVLIGALLLMAGQYWLLLDMPSKVKNAQGIMPTVQAESRGNVK